jgi:paraquat-inducible protein B
VSAKAHPRLVGAFVLGAVALVVAAVLLLSSGDWLAKKDRFAVFFPGSVKGLNPGSPVTFRGIKVGEVKDVTAFITTTGPPIQIEVVIELKRDVVEAPEGAARPFAALTGQGLAKELIARGVRARMQSQSLLTGQRYVELDFLPNEPARFAGVSRRYPELPTTPTAMERMGDKVEQLMAKIADLPLDQMLEDVRRAIQSVREILESPDLKGVLANARRDAEALGPLLADARGAVADARKMIDTLRPEIKETAGSVRETLRTAEDTLDRAERTLASIEKTAGGLDEARMTASETLEELERTLRTMRVLADYIQTHPEAIVLGKPKEKR